MTKITVAQIKAGAEIPQAIYVAKPYVVLSAENVVLHAGDLQSVKDLSAYFDNCIVSVREHDLYLNDNSKIPAKKNFRITFTSPFSFDKTEVQSGIVTAESVSEVMDIYADCNVLSIENAPDEHEQADQIADARREARFGKGL